MGGLGLGSRAQRTVALRNSQRVVLDDGCPVAHLTNDTFQLHIHLAKRTQQGAYLVHPTSVDWLAQHAARDSRRDSRGALQAPP